MGTRRDFLTALAAATLLRPAAAATAAADAASGGMLVATWNLRYEHPEPPNDWAQRRPAVRTVLDAYRPDLLGTQEALYSQVKDVATDQPDYAWLGVGREGGSHGEFTAIFYRRDRFEPLEFDFFWLSDTPSLVGSRTWGNAIPRMVTWARFLDRAAGREFYFWNTHLDHESQLAREKSAALIGRRIRELPATTPLLLVGDFNAWARDNRAYDLLTQEAGLSDTWYAARERRNEDANSFTGFGPLLHEGRRIDWILARGPLEVSAVEAVTDRPGGRWPSDHLPIMAAVRLASK